jgi:class 3 adenylate cyclase
LMSQATYDLLRDEFPDLRALGEAEVAGFDDPVAVFTVAASEPVSGSLSERIRGRFR